MVSLFYDLLAFFGISADAPQNLSEFGIIKDFTHTFARGGRF